MIERNIIGKDKNDYYVFVFRSSLKTFLDGKDFQILCKNEVLNTINLIRLSIEFDMIWESELFPESPHLYLLNF